MSFHQSKGLEFPVVVIGGLDGRFNLKDGNGDILLTEELGLCPRVRPPGTRLSYPSPAHWLASRSLRRQTLAEELWLLYVAMTRACDLLIMTGRITGEQHPRWEQEPGRPQQHLLTANSYLDWLAPWIAQTGQTLWWESPAGHNEFLRWRIVPGTVPSALPATATETAGETPAEPDWQILRQRLEWTYPHQAATREIAKSSVSELRSRASDGDETLARSLVFQPRTEGRGDGRLSAAQKGTAHHLVLQLVSPEQAASALTLRGVLEQMVRDGQLTPAEQAAIALDSIVRFWNSPEGLLIRRQDPACRHTELPFTARFELAELHHLGLLPTVAGAEFVVVQGAIDLAVILPGEIWVLDFNTDALKPGQETEKARQYAPQVQAYALALQKACQRPVTRAWLHFLKLGRTCEVTPVSNPPGTPAG
jgi:ATP-dependent helicase/nuclease subunit A